jgi:hypothetical protein
MSIPVSQQYSELLHYTTLDGLRGILSSGCLWATDASYLNDSSEITHFFDQRLRNLVKEVAYKRAHELALIPQHLATIVKDGGFEKVVDMETDAWQSSLRNVTLAMNRPFVLSFSGPSDARVQHSGLLSQWRGYGGDGGYAIVFDTHQLEAMVAAEAQAHHYAQVLMGDVYYQGIDPKIQPATPDVAEYEAIVHQGISRLVRGGTAEETERFYEAVTGLSCLYKHWGFWEEREVRVVVLPVSSEVAHSTELHAPPKKAIKTVIRNDKHVPYVELFTAAFSGKLPIRRVIVGPHKNRDLNEICVRELLIINGYDVKVVQSEIPYIGK